MNRRVLIDVGLFETRIACLTDDILSDIFITPAGYASLVDEIYVGRVHAFAGDLDAAFIDLGLKKDGFLLSSHMPKGTASSNTSPIKQKLHEGEKILVQVIKDQKEEKGPQLSAFIQLASQNLVFKPMGSGLVFSRQIKDASFKEAFSKSIAEDIHDTAGGLTVRSSASSHSAQQLRDEFLGLRNRWIDLQKQMNSDTKPRCLIPSDPLEIQALKKYTDPTIEIITNDRHSFQMLSNPSLQAETLKQKPQLWTGPGLLFDSYDVEAQIEEVQEVRNALPSGGNITIEQTEALVVIDVNSGSLVAKSGKKSVASLTNGEAVAQICRQLRLRNLSGIIIIDFIRDQDSGAVKALTDQLKNLTRDDPSSVRVIGMTELGLMQLTRRRKEAPLSEIMDTKLTDTCAHISATYAAALLRQASRYCKDYKTAIAPLTVSKALSPLLQHHKARMEGSLGIHIDWKEDASLMGLQYSLGTIPAINE
ncbi:MAG: ribonuclease E/G [Sneathiella sp.]